MSFSLSKTAEKVKAFAIKHKNPSGPVGEKSSVYQRTPKPFEQKGFTPASQTQMKVL